jgi:hypothetical protein
MSEVSAQEETRPGDCVLNEARKGIGVYDGLDRADIDGGRGNRTLSRLRSLWKA